MPPKEEKGAKSKSNPKKDDAYDDEDDEWGLRKIKIKNVFMKK